MPRKKSVHISLNKGGGRKWKVTKNSIALSTHNTQKAAEHAGRSIAKKTHTELVTHGTDGKIRSKDSFGNDPSSIRDKEH